MANDEHSPVNVEETPSATADDVRANAARKRRSVWFVVIFLACTLASLAGYHYAADTRAMYWYLYEVSTHTSLILKTFGESCQVEAPEQFTGSEASVRETLTTWAKTHTLYISEPVSPVPGPPLTPWETFLYRNLLKRATYEECERRLKFFDEAHNVTLNNVDELQEYVGTRLEHMKQGLQPKNHLLYPGPEAIRQLNQIALEYAQTSGSSLGLEAKTKALEKIVEALNALRTQQIAFLQAAEGRLREGLREEGPMVLFTLSVSPDTELRRVDIDRNFLDRATGLSDQDKETRKAALDRRRADAEARKAAGDKTKDRTFHFRVVPDCGALSSMTIFLAAVLAFPAPWRKRLIGALLGLPLLYVVNLMRLVALATLGALDESGRWFDFAHHYIWQGIYLVFVVGVWLLWVEFIVERRPSCEKAAK